MKLKKLKDFLDEQVGQHETPDFIANDPIQIPHLFTKKEDIEISGLLTSIIAWGQRPSIIKNAKKLLEIMEQSPHQYILDFTERDIQFVHRTFNAEDLLFFMLALQNIYRNGDLEQAFSPNKQIPNMKGRIVNFRSKMLETQHLQRSEKHIANPLRNSACKRLNMFLRWMVRSPQKGVDFGVWKSISTSELYLPLDVHVGNQARKLGLLTRTYNDWTALEELMTNLRKFDKNDPAKYDFALFSLGVNNLI